MPTTFGLDSNVLSYILDPAFLEHEGSALILERLAPKTKIAVNSTVIHETYHTLVYKQKLVRKEVTNRILSFLRLKEVIFFNQTRSITQCGIYLANQYDLGGRDSLILANYIYNDVGIMYTHDKAIFDLRKISWKEKELNFEDPVDRS